MVLVSTDRLVPDKVLLVTLLYRRAVEAMAIVFAGESTEAVEREVCVLVPLLPRRIRAGHVNCSYVPRLP
jgi:hypothetical protein